MISLDQVILLEQKVESAVAKIQQLQAENDALRSKCEQLTNALSAKSEQLNTFESDQNQIEDGIKKALDRLNAIENSVLRTATAMTNAGQVASTPTPKPQPITTVKPVVETPVKAEPEAPVSDNFEDVFAPSFDTMEPTNEFTEESFEPSLEEDINEEDGQDGLGFDIF